MHEVSIIQSILRTLEKEFQPEQIRRIVQIDLEVGVFSNVEPVLLENAFEAVKSVTGKMTDARLHIDVKPIKIYCDACRETSLIDNYTFVCHACRKPCTNVIQGTELLIKRVHFSE